MSAAKKFASRADLEEKKISFDKLSEHAYAYRDPRIWTAERGKDMWQTLEG